MTSSRLVCCLHYILLHVYLYLKEDLSLLYSVLTINLLSKHLTINLLLLCLTINSLSMKNIVGTPARGDSFFPREREISKIINRLKAGNNLQIAAPRRVGKTSILFHLQDKSIEGYTYIYVDTESISNEQDFYKKILKEILRSTSIAKSPVLQRLIKAGTGFLGKIKSVSVLETGIEFKDDIIEINFKEELEHFLLGFKIEDETKLVLLLDEFPQTILNIIAANNGDTQAAIQFLQSNRELRQSPDINKKVQFIYTGSIGLNHTVATINASAFVNDLNSVEVEPLVEYEAIQLVTQLLEEKGILISRDAVDHLLQKLKWYIPFHIQLAVQEIVDLTTSGNQVDTLIIDRAFGKIITSRNNSHFEHYHSRLKSQFKGEEFKYAENVLSKLATDGILDKATAYDMAIPYNLEENYRQIIDILDSDGYINTDSQTAIYRFNSPIVRMWWQKYICK